MISWPRRLGKKGDDLHRDSLFDLPLYLSPPQKSGRVDLVSQQFITDINQVITSFSVDTTRRQIR